MMTEHSRDLANHDLWADSLVRSRARRAAAPRSTDLRAGRRSASLAALVAVAAPPAAGVATLAGAAAPSAALASPHVLKRGSHGRAVARLQRALGIAADGIFGPGTARAVKRFQRAHGLVADGVVGPATWSALGGRPASSSGGGRHRHVHVPAGETRRLQRLLGLPVDGIFGPQTRAALKRFQRAHGLTVDGLPGPQSFAALEAARGSRSGRHHRGGGGTVRHLQRLLGVAADGVFGPGTRAAVVGFQRAHGLVADGIVGPATWAALGVRSNHVLRMRHRFSGHHTGRPGVVSRVIAAANRIATRPYRFGGGHGSFTDSGYDCSGSISYALHGGGLLSSPLDSGSFESYGVPGPGRHITIYANAAHAYMVVDGRRYDTSGLSSRGTRWTSEMRSPAAFVVRHPRGY
jgi:peptidoglycan hydrolase-like protein with peptidoglycan-binding domain